MRTYRTRTRHSIAFNMTPMIDVVFLLIVFFMLVSAFASAENVPMHLPDPQRSRARNVELANRLVINCFPIDPAAPASGVQYRLGPNRPQSLGEISDALLAARGKTPDLQVVIRADRRLPYADVREVMKLVADHGIVNMNIVAHVGSEEDGH
ncbi:MAG: biopolymer transporter ExbD [Planctomycetes bacterium]|nr:biopolymer transporter ExbD [Planctomycetota bacterium]